jgi:hypothetical protein
MKKWPGKSFSEKIYGLSEERTAIKVILGIAESKGFINFSNKKG